MARLKYRARRAVLYQSRAPWVLGEVGRTGHRPNRDIVIFHGPVETQIRRASSYPGSEVNISFRTEGTGAGGRKSDGPASIRRWR